ncbi:MAG TPA: right-handed parallel beta-helix repeat-containing protein [Thermoanaerobaculia bacterium]|jgi:hypothetical protein|nr:right-handed parallel beta-helix repeat-containing protein [Thermoanaerobaculia bacterium]
MKKSMQLRILVTAFLTLLASASLAHAQATRTWVSGVGDDANPCSRTAPCKTFAGAISKTAPCGEIDVLDPGGFGALTITKCISIEADGLIAGVLVSGTNGFVVSAGVNDVVMIRGLTFEGLGTGLDGISILQAGKVYVENCEINGFTGFGIDFKPANAGSQLFVYNTTVRNNGASPNGGGIVIAPSPISSVTASLDNVRMESNVLGLRTQDGGQATVQNSIAAGNKFAGLNATTTTATAAALFLDHVVATSNATGVVANGSAATVRMAETSVTANGTGVSISNSGTVGGFGSNNIAGNSPGNDIVGGTITALPVH